MKKVFEVWASGEYDKVVEKGCFKPHKEVSHHKLPDQYGPIFLYAETKEEAGEQWQQTYDKKEVLKKIEKEARRRVYFVEDKITEIINVKYSVLSVDVTNTVTMNEMIHRMSAEHLSEWCRDRLVDINVRAEKPLFFCRFAANNFTTCEFGLSRVFLKKNKKLFHPEMLDSFFCFCYNKSIEKHLI